MNFFDFVLLKAGDFIKKTIYPFITPIFSIINYASMKKFLEQNGAWKGWVILNTVLSLAYFVFTFVFGVFFLINNFKIPK